MDAQNRELGRWSSAQSYGLSVVCLILGVAVGYFAHAPATAPIPNALPHAAAIQGQAAAGAPGQKGPVAQQPTPQEIKAMVDKQAEPLLEKLKKNPADVEVLERLAGAYAGGHQFAQSEQYLERAVKIKPSANQYFNLATSYHFGGSDDKAMESLSRALELDPKFGPAMFNLGVLKLKVNGDRKGAIALWEKIIKDNPNGPERPQIEQMIAKAKEPGIASKP